MKIASLLLLFVCALLYPQARSQSAGWRGIVPLHSTRADVERLIGKPNVPPINFYALGNERASITYTNDPCTEDSEGSYSVPRDTVLSIYVVPQYDLALANLRLDLGKYRRGKDVPIPNHSTYQNDDEGIAYLVDETGVRGKDMVRRILYYPNAADDSLRCPKAVAEQAVENDPNCSPEGGCPMIWVRGYSADPCKSRRLTFTGGLAGVDSRFAATYKWSVSAGKIIEGQGTSEIEVDVSDVCDKPVTATLKVGCVIPEGCPSTETFTTKSAVNSRTGSR